MEPFTSGIATNLTSDLLKVGLGIVRDAALGSAEQRALEKAFDRAFEVLLDDITREWRPDDPANAELASLLAGQLKSFAKDPEIAELLVSAALRSTDLPRERIRQRFAELGFDESTLLTDLDLAFTRFQLALASELRAAAEAAQAPLFNRVSLAMQDSLLERLARYEQAVSAPSVLEVHAERAGSEPPGLISLVPRLAACFGPRDTVRQSIDAVAAAGHVVVLSGMGGVGKTQIAAWYAISRSRDNDVDLVLWVNAANQDGVLSGYAQAAIELHVATDKDEVSVAAARFLKWLSKTGWSWLVVLDDLSDPADLVQLWPPDHPSGRVLITTRRNEFTLRSGRCHLIKVDLFTMAEATEYVHDRLGHNQEQLIDAESLISDLGRLPLALAQATAYMQNLRLTCTQYRQRFADRTRNLARVLPEDAGDEHRYTVAVTWLLSIEAADELDPAGIARPLLQLASELDPNGIPEAVFSTSPIRSWLSERGQEPVALEDPRDGLLCLDRFNLIDFEDGVIRIHALVQRATREQFALERRGVLAVADAALQEVWNRSAVVDWRVISMLVKVIVEADNGERRREVFGQLLNMVDSKADSMSFANAWDATHVIREHFHDLLDLVLDCLGGEQVIVKSHGARPASRVGARPRVTQQAASTLAYCFTAIRDWRDADPDRAIPLLASGLTQWGNRKRFPTALAMYEDRRALDVLLRFARAEMTKTQPDPHPLTTTATALGKLGAAFPDKRADCVGMLNEIINVQDRGAHRAAIKAKNDLTGGADPEPAIDEAEIIDSLAILDGDQYSDWYKVITYIDHTTTYIKFAGLSAELLGAISKALDHQNVVVPEAAARLLGQSDDPRAAVVLRAKLQQPDLPFKVHSACTDALDAHTARNSGSTN